MADLSMCEKPSASLTWSSQNNCRKTNVENSVSKPDDIRSMSLADFDRRLHGVDIEERVPLESVRDPNHKYVTVVCTHCGHYATVPIYCGNRFCNICHSQRQKRVMKRISWLVKNRPVVRGTMLKLLTLTVKNDTDLPRMVKHLLKSFRRLRQRKYFKQRVSGGAFVVELTNKGKGWHAHLHCIIQSQRIDWEKIRDLWRICSNGSTGVDIRNRDPLTCIRYLTKYISKSELPDELQFEASAALRGYRLFNPFGSWYAINRTYVQEKTPCPNCNVPGKYLLYEVVMNIWNFSP